MSMMNGHSSDVDNDRLRPSPQPPRSESELSDLNDLPTTNVSSATPPEQIEPSDDDAIHDMATSELDEDEDAEGEADADFDDESPPPQPAGGMRHDRSPSEDSIRPGKRKMEIDDEEEYMKQNPELYGLRRSVCLLTLLQFYSH
jgi:chromodomain-helicase-DNA-binding protein 1